MATALWTFENLTTTGFEGEADVNLGINIQSVGVGPPPSQAVPVPSVPGDTGYGRLLCSAGKINNFSTDREVALAYTAGNPITLTFKWRPLLEYQFPGPQTAMMGFNLLGFNAAGTVGVSAVDVLFLNTTTPGQYDLQVHTQGSAPAVIGSFDMSLRDWHEFEMSYDGAGTLSFSIDSAPIATDAYVIPTSGRGQLIFAAATGSAAALLGVLDDASLTIS